MTYLFGTGSLTAYRLAYVFGFFIAAISDTSLIWLISAITIALMTIPNLFSILMLRKEMKQGIEDYWIKFRQENSES
jgi:AGCS family alanine or glycine:cation symporter